VLNSVFANRDASEPPWMCRNPRNGAVILNPAAHLAPRITVTAAAAVLGSGRRMRLLRRRLRHAINRKHVRVHMG